MADVAVDGVRDVCHVDLSVDFRGLAEGADL
jgi:hypothetical protein